MTTSQKHKLSRIRLIFKESLVVFFNFFVILGVSNIHAAPSDDLDGYRRDINIHAFKNVRRDVAQLRMVQSDVVRTIENGLRDPQLWEEYVKAQSFQLGEKAGRRPAELEWNARRLDQLKTSANLYDRTMAKLWFGLNAIARPLKNSWEEFTLALDNRHGNILNPWTRIYGPDYVLDFFEAKNEELRLNDSGKLNPYLNTVGLVLVRDAFIELQLTSSLSRQTIFNLSNRAFDELKQFMDFDPIKNASGEWALPTSRSSVDKVPSEYYAGFERAFLKGTRGWGVRLDRGISNGPETPERAIKNLTTFLEPGTDVARRRPLRFSFQLGRIERPWYYLGTRAQRLTVFAYDPRKRETVADITTRRPIKIPKNFEDLDWAKILPLMRERKSLDFGSLRIPHPFFYPNQLLRNCSAYIGMIGLRYTWDQSRGSSSGE